MKYTGLIVNISLAFIYGVLGNVAITIPLVGAAIICTIFIVAGDNL